MISYKVIRHKKLSINEYKKIDNIIQKYNNIVNYEECEKFHYYKYNEETPEIIFKGCIKLPIYNKSYENEEQFWEISLDLLINWIDCLTDIRKEVLKNSE